MKQIAYAGSNGKKPRSEETVPTTLVFNKVPPKDLEIEKAVLGACMLEKDVFDTVVMILKEPRFFYSDNHQKIFQAMQQLAAKNEPIDMLTVTNQLRLNGDLGENLAPYDVTKCTDAVVSAAHIEMHCQIILDKALKREAIRIGGELTTRGYEDQDLGVDILDETANEISIIAEGSIGGATAHVSALLAPEMARLEALRNRTDTNLTGVPSGFPDIDRITYGFQPSDLIIVAARPAVGKTAFALSIARRAALHPVKPTGTAVFSLEMSAAQLVRRMMAGQARMPMEIFTSARADDNQMVDIYSAAVRPLSQAPIFIDDTASLNVLELRAKARRLKRMQGIGLIIIDYLQLMTGIGNRHGHQNREQEIASISRGLKGLAKELEIPIIALSQLSREVERRKGKPQLSDLRESGAIEQDADMVAFLSRPSYGLTEEEMQSKISEYGEEFIYEADFSIRKHRNGPLEEISMYSVGPIQEWFTPTQYREYQNLL